VREIKQGDIIKLSLSPTKGHEQAGYRPAVVVSNNDFNALTKNKLICPITSTDRGYPAHVALDNRIITHGFVMCDQIRTVTPASRDAEYIESVPSDILDEILDILHGLIEK
jgi:mRNA interferase MazF